ncbi:MAG: CopG family transcriptional regulator [Nitrospinae bacterium CG22_combo_CG10-13_8_21_14_all_47_10]|nr:MAG: CopG family transcriptional regulator [Nitrospinae bacterium CG22_combo_CG10-13_8_21_14_all_47_10]
MAQNSGNVTVRVSSDIQKKLDQIAAGFDRSRNWLINEAIENYLDIYEWQEKRIKDRLKKAEKGGKFLSSDQVDKIVESFKP